MPKKKVVKYGTTISVQVPVTISIEFKKGEAGYEGNLHDHEVIKKGALDAFMNVIFPSIYRGRQWPPTSFFAADTNWEPGEEVEFQFAFRDPSGQGSHEAKASVDMRRGSINCSLEVHTKEHTHDEFSSPVSGQFSDQFGAGVPSSETITVSGVPPAGTSFWSPVTLSGVNVEAPTYPVSGVISWGHTGLTPEQAATSPPLMTMPASGLLFGRRTYEGQIDHGSLAGLDEDEDEDD